MKVQEQINNDVKIAMKEKRELELSVLRMVKSAMHNRSIEKRAKGGEEELTEEESLATLRSEVKKRKDAIGEYTKGGRPELAEKESKELAILEKYLPQEMNDTEIETIVRSVVAELGSLTQKDFGKIMGEAMSRIKGQASGDRVSRTVKKILTP